MGRQDLAGKTGTTNEHVDAWFCGYNTALVGVAWVGYDQPKNLGRNETGGQTSLPIWMAYMEKAPRGNPVVARPVWAGVATAVPGVDPAMSREGKSAPEFFYKENVPEDEPVPPPDPGPAQGPPPGDATKPAPSFSG